MFWKFWCSYNQVEIEYSICCRLLKLPAFVRMIITSRPDEGKGTFKDCKPREIKPEFKRNQDDLEGLLNVRLKDYDNVPGEELKSEAVEIILEKSKVWIQTRRDWSQASFLSEERQHECLFIDSSFAVTGPVHLYKVCIHVFETEDQDQMEQNKAGEGAAHGPGWCLLFHDGADHQSPGRRI